MAVWRKVWERLQEFFREYERRQSSRDALRQIIARRDIRLLKDAGLYDPTMLLMTAGCHRHLLPFADLINGKRSGDARFACGSGLQIPRQSAPDSEMMSPISEK